MATLGYTTIGSSAYGITSDRCMEAVAAEDGTVTSILVYVALSNAMRLSLYKGGSAGNPTGATLMVDFGQISFTSAGWYTLTVAGAVSAPDASFLSGDRLWEVALNNAGTNVLRKDTAPVGDFANGARYNTGLTTDPTQPADATIPGAGGGSTNGISIYIFYTPSSGSTYSLALDSVAISLGVSDLTLPFAHHLALGSVATSLAVSDLGFIITVTADSVATALGVSDLGLRYHRRFTLGSVAVAADPSDLGLIRPRSLTFEAPAVALGASDLVLSYLSGYVIQLGSVAIASDAADLGLRAGRKIALGIPAMLLGASDLGLRYDRRLALGPVGEAADASNLTLTYSRLAGGMMLDPAAIDLAAGALGLALTRALSLEGAAVTLAIGDLGLSLDTGLDVVPTTPLDAPLRRVAQKLIAKFGKQIVLRFVTTGAYDTSTRTYSRSTADQVIRALIESPGLDTRKAKGESGPGGSKTQEWKLTIAAMGLLREPTAADLAVIGSQELEITGVDPTYSGGQVALYELRVKR